MIKDRDIVYRNKHTFFYPYYTESSVISVEATVIIRERVKKCVITFVDNGKFTVK